MANGKEGFVSEVTSASGTINVAAYSNISEGNVLQITGHKLNGENFNQWSHFAMIFVCGKGKEEYLTGEAYPPVEIDPQVQDMET